MITSLEPLHKLYYINTQEEHFSSVWPYIASTPIYKNKLRAANVDIQSIKSLSDLSLLPLTFKADIRKSSVFERTPLRVENVYAIYSSGGTSGDPTLYAWNFEDVQIQMEISRRVLKSVGMLPSDLALILAPLSLPVMGHCMIRQYDAVGAGFVPLGPSDPQSVFRFIQELPITVVATLPVVASRLYDYLRFVKNINVTENAHIRQFHFGGDSLSDALRKRLEINWSAQCYDFYGISEIFGPVSGECQYQNGHHFAADYIYMEILDPKTLLPVLEGERGVAVYTTLWKKGFPLLRYWSDDYVSIKWDQCKCGLQSPRVFYHGRPIDSAQTPNGLLFTKDIEERVLRFPISNEYYLEYKYDGKEYVDFQVEPFPGVDLPIDDMAEELSDQLGLPVKVKLNQPGSLPRESIKPKRLINFPTSLDQ